MSPQGIYGTGRLYLWKGRSSYVRTKIEDLRSPGMKYYTLLWLTIQPERTLFSENRSFECTCVSPHLTPSFNLPVSTWSLTCGCERWRHWQDCVNVQTRLIILWPDKPYEPTHDKTNKMTVRPAKTQISQAICPVWSESSLCAQWEAKSQSFRHVDREDSNQTGRMPRLIWIFAGRTYDHLPYCWFCHVVAQLYYERSIMNPFLTV